MKTDAKKIVKIEYTASTTLEKFHNSPAFVRGIRGPIGSGKSVGCCFELFRMACMQSANALGVRKSRAIIVRNTLPELFSTTIKTWKDWFPPGNPKKEPGTFGEFTGRPPYTHFVKYGMPDGTLVDLEVMFLALDQPEDAKKLLSLEASFIWFNEAREIHKNIVDAATGRVGRYPSAKEGGCSRPAMIMDTNPPDDSHWWYQLAEEDVPKDWEFFTQPSGLSAEAENLENLLQTTETLTLPMDKRREWGRKQYYERICEGKNQEWIDVYVHGHYGFIKKGQPVYASCWNQDIHVHRQPVKINPKGRIVIGIDASGRHPAAVFLQPTARGHWDIVHELCVLEDEGMGAVRFAKLLEVEIKRKFPESDIENPLWGDPAGDWPSQNDEKTYFQILNEALRSSGLKVKASPGFRFPERYEAVEYMLSTLIDGRPMMMVSPNCRTIIRGFNGGYMFRQISTAGDIRFDERPLKNRFADPHDGLQYAACGIGALRGYFKKTRRAQKVHTVGDVGGVF
jgi:hypothetical protein